MRNQKTTHCDPNHPARTETRKSTRVATRRASGIALAAALVFAGASPIAAALAETDAAPMPGGPPEPNRGDDAVPELLRDDKLVDQEGFKYRIMVDKVNIDRKESVDEAIEAGDFEKYAELGFNVLVPRKWAKHGPEQIGAAAKRAGELGMYHMHWMRGSYKGGRPRFVHRDGHEYKHMSPTNDKFWQRLEDDILPVVKLSTRYPVLGVFFDFEKYEGWRNPDGSKGHFTGHWYPISYDDHAWAMFYEQRGDDVPEVAPAERADHLEKRDLAGDFRQFQIDYWRSKARALREKIDAINPRFRFACYNSSFTLFINQVVWKELATDRAPLLAAEHYTYGRGNPLKDTAIPHWKIPDDQAVTLDRAFLRKMRNKYRGRKPHAVLGGIDPQVKGGEDAQLTARKVHMYSQHFDGYWIFYEGVVQGSAHERNYDLWWKIANEAIVRDKDTVLYDLRIEHPHLAEEWLDQLNAAQP